MTSSEVERKPVRISVVDTGVDPACSAFEGQEVQGVGVERIGDDYYYDADFRDLSGHGTAMAARIQSFCKSAQICAVRIAQRDEDGVAVRVQEQALAMGIEWCIQQGIRIVNVSYSIAEAPHGGFLARACHKARENGTILVAAYRGGEEEMPVYPAAFPTVIGVRRRDDLKLGEVAVLSEENLDLHAWGRSNSSATAQVSAMVGFIRSTTRWGWKPW